MDKSFLINILFVFLAVIALALTVWVFVRIKKVKTTFKSAIILIPLYYNKVWHLLLVVADIALMIVCVAMIFFTKEYVIFGSLVFILVTLLAMAIGFMTCRFAVLDSGIVVPFKYIDWLHVYEYKIEGNKVFFFRDTLGYDTIRGISPKLRFDIASTEKLEFLLNKYKVK